MKQIKHLPVQSRFYEHGHLATVLSSVATNNRFYWRRFYSNGKKKVNCCSCNLLKKILKKQLDDKFQKRKLPEQFLDVKLAKESSSTG